MSPSQEVGSALHVLHGRMGKDARILAGVPDQVRRAGRPPAPLGLLLALAVLVPRFLLRRRVVGTVLAARRLLLAVLRAAARSPQSPTG